MSVKTTTDLNFLPVCDCGHVFLEGVEVVQEPTLLTIAGTEVKSKYCLGKTVFSPPSCPDCNRAITSIKLSGDIAKKLFATLDKSLNS